MTHDDLDNQTPEQLQALRAEYTRHLERVKGLAIDLQRAVLTFFDTRPDDPALSMLQIILEATAVQMGTTLALNVITGTDAQDTSDLDHKRRWLLAQLLKRIRHVERSQFAAMWPTRDALRFQTAKNNTAAPVWVAAPTSLM